MFCSVWLVSPIFVTLELVQVHLAYDPTTRKCERERSDYVFFGAMVGAASVTLVAYIIALVVVHLKTGFAVKHRERVRVQLFILVWLICTFPNALRVLVMIRGSKKKSSVVVCGQRSLQLRWCRQHPRLHCT